MKEKPSTPNVAENKQDKINLTETGSEPHGGDHQHRLSLLGNAVSDDKRWNFEQYFAYSAVSCYILSADGIIMDVNYAMLGALHCTEQDLVGKPVSTIYAPESRIKLDKLFARIRLTGQIQNEEMIVLTKSGQRRTVLLNVGTMRDTNGKIKYLTSVQTDITERIHAEQVLKKTEERYSMSFRSIAPAVSISRLNDGFMREVNTAFEGFTGYRQDEIMGRTSIELGLYDNPKDRDRMVKELGTRGTFQDWEVHFRAKDGTLVIRNVSAELIELGGEPCMLAVFSDQSEYKRAEDALRKLSPAVEQSPASIIITDTTGTIEYVNNKFTELTGYSAEEVIGRNPRLLKSGHTTDEEYRRLWNIIISGGEWHGLFYNKKKNGDLYWANASIFPVLDQQGKITNYVGLQEDVTEHIRVEAALHKSEEQFRRLFENSPLGLYRATAKGEIKDINLAASRMLGYERPEHLIGLSHHEFLINTGDRKLDRSLLDADGMFDFEAQICRRDNRLIWIRIRGRTILEPQSRELFVEGSLEDITERKTAGEALLGQLAFNKLMTDLLSQFVNSLEPEIDDSINGSLRQIGRFFAAESAFITLILPDSNYWSLVYSWVAEGIFDLSKKFQHIPNDTFPWTEKTLREGYVFQFDSLDELPPGAGVDKEYYRAAGTKSNLSVPIRGQGGLIIGCLGLSLFTHEGSWSKDDAWRLELIGNTLANVLERKQAQDSTRHRTRELEIITNVSAAMRKAQTRLEICRVILHQLSVLLKSQGAALALRDPKTNNIVIELGYRNWKGWTGTQIPTGEGAARSPISSGDAYQKNNIGNDPFSLDSRLTNNLACVAGVPLIANEQSIGTLWIGRKTAILQEDMQLLAAIGNIAANAIQRQTLHEDLQTQLEALRNAQARLLQSEKLAAIGQLVSGVAHELNNPLTSVVLYSQLAQQSDLDELTRSNLSKVVSEARRAGLIVRGLLDFARQRPPKREIIQVNDVLKLSLGLVSYELRAHNIELDLQLSTDLPVILADPHQLHQVFVNLIQNAWQAMNLTHGGGHLKIFTGMGKSDYPVPSDDGREWVKICFSNDGPGISQEIMPRIFDPFFTTKPEGSGTGLGLSICHGIITEHGGHVWAESPAGQGTTFFIELPMPASWQAIQPEHAETNDMLDVSTNIYRVLVLDDEPNVSDVLAQALRRKGYNADIVSNGAEGLTYLQYVKYDVVLCDIRMPELNGLEFYRHIEKDYPQLVKRIVFITGDTVNTATRNFIEEKDVRYLAKPFELSELLNAIQTVIDQTL